MSRWIQRGGAGARGAPGPPGVSGGSGGFSAVYRPSLTHGTTTTITSPGAGSGDGAIILYILKQPSTAQAQVAWTTSGSNPFSGDTPNAIDTFTANSEARIAFYWDATASKWVYFSVMNSGGII